MGVIFVIGLCILKERFFADDELLGKDSSKWWIPLTYTTECDMEFNRTMPKRWLSPSKPTVSMKSPLSPADWVIFNIDATALYIVNYDEENWHLLIDFLKTPFFERIPTMNRVLLIESAARLAWVGRLDYRIFFDMVKYVEKDDDLQPIYAAVSRVYDLNTLLKRMPVRKKFIAYSRRIFHSKEQSTLSAKNEMTKFMLHNGRMSTDACKYPAESCMQGPIYPQRRSMMTYILVS